MKKQFKNTFVPHCENEWLTAENVRFGMMCGVIDPDRVPPEVMAAVKGLGPMGDDLPLPPASGVPKVPLPDPADYGQTATTVREAPEAAAAPDVPPKAAAARPRAAAAEPPAA